MSAAAVLAQAYAAVIEYVLPETGPVRLSVYDLVGRRLRTLVERDQGAGPQAAVWNGTTDDGAQVGAGVYILHLETNVGTRTQKLVLVR